jgi:hypothetical protein
MRVLLQVMFLPAARPHPSQSQQPRSQQPWYLMLQQLPLLLFLLHLHSLLQWAPQLLVFQQHQMLLLLLLEGQSLLE